MAVADTVAAEASLDVVDSYREEATAEVTEVVGGEFTRLTRKREASPSQRQHPNTTDIYFLPFFFLFFFSFFVSTFLFF